MKIICQDQKVIVHKANTRGHVKQGWLDTWHTFSFANYFNPERTAFGKLRVINDDSIAPGMGFGLHPHQDMEIITIPLTGALKHTDNTGNEEIIESGQIQVMTAGKGIWHSEFNASSSQNVTLLQIWIFPEQECLEPYYETKTFPIRQLNNEYLCVAGSKKTTGSHLPINQNAYVNIGQIDQGKQLHYSKKDDKNGVYLFVIEGDLNVNDILLSSRDGIGICETLDVVLHSKTDARFVIFEIPLE